MNANIIDAWENKIEIDRGKERSKIIYRWCYRLYYDKKEADGTKEMIEENECQYHRRLRK